MEWMLLPYRRYFDFSGRSRRKEYWSFALFVFLVYMVLFGLTFALSPSSDITETASSPGSLRYFASITSHLGHSLAASVFAGLLGLFWLFSLIPAIAVVVRRLHDRDLSGWWYLGFFLILWIPFIGAIASIVFLVFMFLDGTPGSNRFGPDPKGRGMAEVFS